MFSVKTYVAGILVFQLATDKPADITTQMQ